MPDRRPNILLITSDQQHWDTLGVDNAKIKTPALDRLAREGTRFTRAYCNNPTCTPSRASIITGQYPAWHGGWSIGVKTPEDQAFLGDLLADHGYDTTLVGKAHFQPLASAPGSPSVECQPTLRDLDFWKRFQDDYCPWYGFQHVETCRNHADEAHVGGHYAIWMEEQGLTDWEQYYQPWPPRRNPDGSRPAARRWSWDLPEDLHYTPWTAERTIAHLDRAAQNDKPFFLWSSFHDPHPPYLVPEPWASMYDPADMPIGQLDPDEVQYMSPFVREATKPRGEADYSAFKDSGGYANHGLQSHQHDPETLKKDMAVYYGMTSFMDHHIGRILDRLDELGIADNTIVVFTTDHGHFLGQHGLIAKAFHYEDNLRLPFLVRWPGHVEPGSVSDALQSLVDLTPTFLDAAGIPIPGAVQGVSQTATWSGGEASRQYVIAEHRHQPTRLTVRTYIDDRYKLTLYRGQPYGELFDLQEDPHELHNRWDDPDPAWQTRKRQLLFDFLQAEMDREPTPMPRIAHA